MVDIICIGCILLIVIFAVMYFLIVSHDTYADPNRIGCDIKLDSDDKVMPSEILHFSYTSGGSRNVYVDVDASYYDVSSIVKIRYDNICILLDSICAMQNIGVCSRHIVYASDGGVHICSKHGIFYREYDSSRYYWRNVHAYIPKSLVDKIRYRTKFKKQLQSMKYELYNKVIQNELSNIYGLGE